MARKKRLLWHLFFSHFVVILVSLVAVTWYASTSMRHFFLDQIQADLKVRALQIESEILEFFGPLQERPLDRLCKSMAKSTATRITVILPTGKVVADSDEEPAKMDNHLDRPEISSALKTGFGASSRYSPTLKVKMMYVALPLKRDNHTVAVLRTSIPVDAVDVTLKNIQAKIALGGVIIAALAAILSFLVSDRIRRPIEEIRRGAESFARGNFRYRLHVSDLEEIASLSETMNQMAGKLQEQIDTISGQRNELEAVLSSMVEGVLAVDKEERILSMNRAAGEIFQCDPSASQGRSIQEVVRHPDLQQFVISALSSGEAVEKDVILYAEEKRILHGHGTILRDARGERGGALIVLNDVTRLRRLENIRRDFVANVSHEIKTPITAIKGFVETLRDGAAKRPRDAEHFLEIIQRHVDRLEALVEDLLCLSRIEKEVEEEEILLEEGPIREVLVAAIQVCEVKAAPKNIPLGLSCDEGLKAKMNPALLEQAVVNLLDNAIKYSDVARPVKLEAAETSSEIVIHVHDEGRGIEKRHLSRLFERFYRVDGARSRRLGGTGLGLAIVKHIMQAHGGRVSVESQAGKGSTFTLHLPKPVSLTS
ncbi:MAG: cell wall metabolism sensor histidine kinase WalK [Proteobacteria bacterium]|nr:cell wall metabolism sensor histidine kinase WalK [Pseudomonadota bacterium]